MADTVETNTLIQKNPETKSNSLFAVKTERNLLMFGPVGSGKTTTFTTLCDSITVEDEFFIHGERVNLTCGKLNISSIDKLFLYTTSKHDYSQPVWEFLQKEMLGIILLIDNRRKDPLRDLEMFLTRLSYNKSTETVLNKLVIGITHVDVSMTPEVLDFHSVISSLNLKIKHNPPIFSVDTRKFQDMSMLVQALLYSQDPTLKL